MAADALAVALSLAGTYVLAETVGPPAVIAPAWLLALLVPLAGFGWLAIFAVYRLYEGESRAIAPNSFDEVGRLASALLAGSLLYLLFAQGIEKVSDWFVY
ncbi:MAG: hypothetical protein M3O90_07500, partial [Actinomycetota bacterium]|nr:hypothetical protein [Actinomycetota bacterium]